MKLGFDLSSLVLYALLQLAGKLFPVLAAGKLLSFSFKGAFYFVKVSSFFCGRIKSFFTVLP